VLPEENEHQMAVFLEHHPDAREVAIGATAMASHGFGTTRPVGLQILPGDHDMDGFYYACIEKN
jgi:16S rRNA (cytosine967-C5)-methyltransferase